MASLNLPACIETTAAGSALPPSLLEKAKEVRERGGLESLKTLINELPEALNRNREILDETERILNEERDSDSQLRAQFKERWTRTPSDKLTEMFRSNASKYRSIIDNAVAADKIVREKFDVNSRGVELLSKSPQELQIAIPASAGGSNSNSPSAKKLAELMEQVETIKAERDTIEIDLKSATVNMKDQFIHALQQDGAINEPVISVAQIGKVLGPLQQQVQDSITRQQILIQEIQEAHSKFTRESGSGTNSRDALFSELAKAYDTFCELQNNLKEGTKFYNDLTQLLIVFQSKISDFCFARKTEKEELMKDLTTESSRQVPASTPSVPSHHSTTDSSSRAPPARPPQPQNIQASQNVIPSNIPYPTQQPNMPIPYQATPMAPYPTYMAAPPMPQSFNPYGTMPYPSGKYY